MDRNEVLQRIKKLGVLPVVRASSGEEALALVAALRAGGIDVIELTMTVPGAVEIVRELVKTAPGCVVGAGTVLDAETARACLLAGARFVVSPIVDEPTIALCRTYGAPVMAGALTPTEVVRAWRAGSDLVKVFPCGAVGGASYLKALKAPLPQIELIPTGGVSLETAGDFIAAGASAVGAGADLVDPKRIRAGEAAWITDRAGKYLAAVAKARGQAS
jgi:2-dehydro-3-deoxyphosphogluconate aldolase/(4S)-4-hydroxy-2-oxoglutarate aldolase